MLQIEGLSKDYGNVVALRDFDLEIGPGVVHGLVGVNGAGKSTVIKLLSGTERATAGSIAIPGVGPVEITTPRDAQEHGIGVVHQELPLLPNLTAAENVALALEPWMPLRKLPRRWLRERYAQHAAAFDDAPDPSRKLEDCSLFEWQLVAIIRALAAEAQVLILDEPTSSLGARERAALHATLRKLTASGRSVLYVSHFLDDVLDVCDEVTVLRDGRVVSRANASDYTEEALLRAMLGEAGEYASVAAPSDVPPSGVGTFDDPGLEVKDLYGPGFGPLSLRVDRGEVVGLYGLQGCGSEGVLQALLGTAKSTGVVRWRGAALRGSSAARVLKGVGYVSGDRKRTLIGDWTVAANHGLPELVRRSGLALRASAGEAGSAQQTIRRLGVVGRAEARMRSLSGGNQQKVALGRLLVREGSLLLLDEPTHGVDVAGRANIHKVMTAYARTGGALLLRSSDPEEIVAVCDRVLVMSQGRLVAALDRSEISVDVLEGHTRSGVRHAQ